MVAAAIAGAGHARGMTARDIVLVHGAWHGGWCWDAVAPLLSARGHRVTAPTLPGLADRADLLHTRPTLDTFVGEVADLIEAADLRQVVLVGHSFAGMVIAGVADRIAPRLRQLVFLDCGEVADGLAAIDRLTPAARAVRLAEAEAVQDGLAFPPPDASVFGLTDPAHRRLVEARTTPQPMGTYTQALRLRGRPGAGLRCDYVLCTAPAYQDEVAVRRWVEPLGWPLHRLAAGHDAMISHPVETADLLGTLAG